MLKPISLILLTIVPTILGIHILSILADDLGFADVAYNAPDGYKNITTPFIDRYSKGSEVRTAIRFSDHEGCPKCTPTRAAYLTGRYPFRYGFQGPVLQFDDTYGLPNTETLFPEILKKHNVYTAISGKWHLGSAKPEYLPLSKGFQYQYGIYGGQVKYYGGRHQSHGWSGIDVHRNQNGVNITIEDYVPYKTADEVVNTIIDEIIERNYTDSFVYIPFNSVHVPYDYAPDPYKTDYENNPYMLSEDRKMYASMVSAMDKAIGDVIRAYKLRGLWDSTFFQFFVDNGGGGVANNYPLRGGKDTVFQGGLQNMAYINVPKTWLPYADQIVTFESTVHMVDWYPTYLKLLNIDETPNNLDGTEIWSPLQSGNPTLSMRPLYTIQENMACIRKERYKLILGNTCTNREKCGWNNKPETQPEFIYAPSADIGVLDWFFDIQTDPREQNNLYNDIDYRLIIIEYEKMLIEVMNNQCPPLTPGGAKECANPINWDDFWHEWDPFVGSVPC